MESKGKRVWSAQEKFAILEEGREPDAMVSAVCRRHQIAAAQYYLWERQAKEGAIEALRPSRRGRKPKSQEEQLKAEVIRLQSALGELALENLHLKRGR